MALASRAEPRGGMNMWTTSSVCGRARTWARPIVAGMAAAAWLYSASPARASTISSVTGCVAMTCTIEPVAGPVDVDPTGFSLDVEWSEILHFFEDAGGHGLMRLYFEYTGIHDGTEFFGHISFVDTAGNPLLTPDAEFDDSTAIAGLLTANYEIFGPESFLGGFSLDLSDGSGVDTLRWTSATIWPAQIETVPEPSALLLLGAGAGIAAWRRYRGA
jgi:hypothetical protein